jgi:hypothetical protein
MDHSPENRLVWDAFFALVLALDRKYHPADVRAARDAKTTAEPRNLKQRRRRSSRTT